MENRFFVIKLGSKQSLTFIGSLLVPILIGFALNFFIGTSAYDASQKPLFAAPDTAFPIVWGVVNILAACGAYLVWQSTKMQNIRTLERGAAYYLLGLGLYALWVVAFFLLQFYLLSVAAAVLHVALTAAAAHRFLRISKPAAALVLPLLLWGAYVTYLSVSYLI